MEMLWYLSTDSFLKAVRRFIDHNARPRKIYCDKGTNFVAGDKEVNKMWDEISQTDVQDLSSREIPGPVIEFHFAPPEAHHFSGLVERYVGIAKSNLIAILREKYITDEDLETAFKDVQRLLNNRPIDLKSYSDPNNLQPLTPADFLRCGKVLEDLTPSGMSNESRSPVKSYWILSKIMDQFWYRLVHGMAPYLRSYNKWKTKRDQVKVGDVVCLLEEHPEPSNHQRLAVIEEVTPGSDGIVRRVKVRVQNGKTYDRALNRIYVVVPVERLQPNSNNEKGKTDVVAPPLRRSSRISKRKRKKSVVLVSKLKDD